MTNVVALRPIAIVVRKFLGESPRIYRFWTDKLLDWALLL
jgi:hypothetical protein